MNYEKDIEIDASCLDWECLRQADLMLQVTRLQSKLENERDLEKEKLDLIQAGLDKKIRENPEKYELPKITEGAVSNAIIANDEYQEQLKIYHEAKYEANVAKGAVVAFNQRKDMLEALIKLHGLQWFAGPNVPHNLEELRERKQTESNKKVKIRRRTT